MYILVDDSHSQRLLNTSVVPRVGEQVILKHKGGNVFAVYNVNNVRHAGEAAHLTSGYDAIVFVSFTMFLT